MRLNKKGKIFLLGTLLKGYFVQIAICSVIVMIGTIVLDLAASSLSRRWFGEFFFWYYRALYAYVAGVMGALYYVADLSAHKKSSQLCL